MIDATAARHRILRAPLIAALALGAILAGCGGDHTAEEALDQDRTPRQLVLVYDRSTSITSDELELYQRLTGQALDGMSHGDRIVAIELLQLSLDETPNRWSQSVPEREFPDRRMQRDSLTRVRFLRDARDYLRSYTEAEDREEYLGTDILSTLHDVSADVAAYPGHETTVVIFSDMLQANDEINMEGLANMPAADWLQERASQSRLPDLSGACVVIVGARTDTQPGQRVKDFWEQYFATTGAVLLDRNYQYRPVEIPARSCPGQSPV